MVSNDDLDAEITDLMDEFLRDVLGEAEPAYTDGTDLVADLHLDSLDFVTLMTEIETRWDLELADITDGRVFATIGSVRAFIRAALTSQAGTAAAG
jgi:acyl carrier protein